MCPTPRVFVEARRRKFKEKKKDDLSLAMLSPGKLD